LLFGVVAGIESLSEQNDSFGRDRDWKRKALLARVAARAVIVDEVLAERVAARGGGALP
jgi:hypothetical protein